MDSIQEKLKNPEEWKKEKERIVPFLEAGIECYLRAKHELLRKDYEKAIESYKKAIENYKKAFTNNPKYSLSELVEKIGEALEGHINNMFNFKTCGDKLSKEETINEFVDFLNRLRTEEKEYIDQFEIANAYVKIGDLYYYQKKDLNKAYDFYVNAINSRSARPFLEKGTFSKMAEILFALLRFKEALVCFVSVLSYDRSDRNARSGVSRCLERLNILQYRERFEEATPIEAKKLIMEVL